MAVRRESVVLDLDDRLTPGLIRAAAAAGVLDRELNKLGGQSVRTSRSVSDAETEVRNLGNTAGGSSREIDRFSGRVGILADAVLTLGPAAVTVGAVAVPAVAALGSELGFAAVGAGTAVLAFHGLGTALTAFNKAAAAPTATNIAAAQTAMDKIPPSAQRFVLELHRLNPELSKLRESAASGLFDGLTSGLRVANGDLPLARRLLHNVSTELGTLADQAGHSLASSTWRPFLKFVGQEAPQALDDMGHAAGSVTHGIAGLWMAFGPMNRDISTGIRDLAADFDRWANSVGRTQGFKDFLAYVDANGPRVLDTLGQIGITLIDVGTAAAPIGGPVLDVLKSLFEIIDAIATSDFGTPLLAGILAFRLYARAAQLAGVQVETSFKGMASAPAQMSAGLSSLQAKTAAWARATAADIGTVTRSWVVADSTQRQAAAQSAAAGRLRGTAATAIKGGAAAAGIAFVASGAADSMGLANTASLALMGTLAGPWGAAVGGAIGLTLDLAHANDSLAESQNRAEDALKGTDYGAAAAAVSDFSAQSSAAAQQVSDAWDFSKVGSPQGSLRAIADLFTHQTDEDVAARHEIIAKQAESQSALMDIGRGLGTPGMGFGEEFAPNSAEGIAKLSAIASRAQPAMTALGISMSDLQDAAAANDGTFTTLTGRIVAWINNADSAGARTHAVARAFADMGDQSLTLDDRVQALSDSLDALLGPGLNLGQAHDAFTQGLNDIGQSISKVSHSLRGNTDAAIQNRAAIRTQVTNLAGWIKAQAAAGASSSQMSATLRRGRAAIIEQGRAAGLNAGQIRHMIDVMGLTPKLIQTSIRLVGDAAAISAAQRVSAALAAIRDKTVTITTRQVTGGRSVAGNADGGFIEGPGGPRDDVIPAWLSNGEFVVNAAATARNLSLLHSINAQKFADGGRAGGSNGNHADPVASALSHHLHNFDTALQRATKSLDKEQQIRDSIAQAAQQQMSTVRDAFRSDFLGVEAAGPWAAASDPFSILRGDIRGARQFGGDIRHLRKRGISAALAGQITTLAQAEQVDDMSNRQLRQLEHLFRVRQRASSAAGRSDAAAAFGEKLSEANHHLARLRGDVHHLTAEVKNLKAEQAKHAKRTGDAVGDKINGASSTAARRARR